MNLFCAGVGLRHPDITGASRRMLPSEFELCQRNGVTSITEIPLGSDGIVVARAGGTPDIDVERRELYLGLAATIPMPVDSDGEPVFNASGALLSGRDFNDVAAYSCERCLQPFAFASRPMEDGRHLLMPLYVCRKWDGFPDPKEGQKIAWVMPRDLNKYALLPADIPLAAELRDRL